jgi:hypothetical protein
LVDFNAVLRLARENAAKSGVTGVTGVTSKANGSENKGMANLAPVTPSAFVGVTGVTGQVQADAGRVTPVTPPKPPVLPEKPSDINTVTPVTPEKSNQPQFRLELAKFKESRPHGVTRFRHGQACWAAEMFLTEWEELAFEFEWPVDDIFGRGGLAMWLGVEIVTALGPEHAVTETNRVYDRVTHADWLNAYGVQGNG